MCFCHLLLLSVVAYSVVMGALMASGKEVIGRIPKGKVSEGQLESPSCFRTDPHFTYKNHQTKGYILDL